MNLPACILLSNVKHHVADYFQIAKWLSQIAIHNFLVLGIELNTHVKITLMRKKPKLRSANSNYYFLFNRK